MKCINNYYIIVLIIASCSIGENFEPLEQSEPKAMNVFCQSNANDTIQRVVYEYDMGKILSETTFLNAEIYSINEYQYNAGFQVLLETYASDFRKTEKTFIYNELNQLVNIQFKYIDFDINGNKISENESEAPREYENNLLVKEWESWGGFNTYTYSNGKVQTKIDYTKNAQKHHITNYKYSRNLLIEEKKETVNGGLIYLKTYKYDSQNRLIRVLDGENTIEEYLYIDDKLIEKRINYFGIDPGFSVCLGNFKYTYEY